MVYINIFGLECGTAGDAVILRAERVYKGGAGSKAEDTARDWKPDAKEAAAAKAALGGKKTYKPAFKMTLPASVAPEGGAGSPIAFLQRRDAAIAVLAKYGVAGSLKKSWDGEEGSAGGSGAAWVGVKIKADPTGLTVKKLVEELRGACTKSASVDSEPDDDD